MTDILLLLLGVFIGWVFREYVAKRSILRMIERAEKQNQENEETEEFEDRNRIRVTIEQHDNMYFVYNMDTSEFMAQGQTIKDLEESLRKNFPNKIFTATEENMKEVGYIS